MTTTAAPKRRISRALVDEFGLAVLEADGVDDALALDALEAGDDGRPLRGVHHHRHPGDVGLGGDQLEEAVHGRLRVEHGVVHVDVDHLGAVVHLLAGDLEGGGEVAVQDQLPEAGRTGHVAALAHVHEAGDLVEGEGLQAAQAAAAGQVGRAPGREAAHSRVEGGDVLQAWCRSNRPPG